MTSSILILPAAIEGVRTMKDRTMRIVIGTQELTPEHAAQLISHYNNGYGFIALKKEEFAQEERDTLEAIKLNADELGGKTPSQRLRNTLYVLYSHRPEGFNTFNAYYEHCIEQFIAHVKKQIDQ